MGHGDDRCRNREKELDQVPSPALDKMVLFGPFPSPATLTELATDESFEIRCRVATLCGLKANATHLELLGELIADSHPRVRRMACQAYMRIGENPEIDALIPMLSSKDRIESMAARKALEKIPAAQWEKKILDSDDIRVSLQSALAIVTSQPNLENSYKVLARCSAWMDGFVNDDDFIDLLRVVQLSLAQGDVDSTKIPAFVERIRSEFPCSNGIINRELARIMAYLKTGSIEQRISDYFRSHSDSADDKLHVALYLQTIGTALSNDERLALIEYLEDSYQLSGGGSYKFYLSRDSRRIQHDFDGSGSGRP